MEMTVGCSHQDCTRLATRQTTIELIGQRSAGERMLVWVCSDHVKAVQPIKKAGFVQRVLALTSLRGV